MKPIVVGIIAVPLCLAAGMYVPKYSRCCRCVDASAASIDDSFIAGLDDDCCEDEPADGKSEKRTVQDADPAKQLAFKVEALRCPAVKGIGCGHMLRPMLRKLDKIEGVQASSANYTGTMIRVAVVNGWAKKKVAEAVCLALEENKPAPVEGEELTTALSKEQWREAWRIGELSAIEFHAIAAYRIATFAKNEKLDKERTAKLTKLADEFWDKLMADAKKEKSVIRPQDWLERTKTVAVGFLARAKEVLSEEQVERLTAALRTQCRGDDRPEAPPPVRAKAAG